MNKANLIALLILKIAGTTHNSSPIADILHCAIVVDYISKGIFQNGLAMSVLISKLHTGHFYLSGVVE